MSNREDLVKFIADAFSGRTDKAGKDYFLHHLVPVSMMVPKRLETAALGHDLLEDTDTTIHQMSMAGFSDDDIYLIHLLTRRKGIPTEIYYRTIRDNQDALIIKLADVYNNISRLDNIQHSGMHAHLRIKYDNALKQLLQR